MKNLCLQVILAFIILMIPLGLYTFPVKANGEVNILSHTGYLDSLGYYHVVGEVENVGDFALHYVKITATFYDTADIVVATDFTFSELDVLLAERKAPFDLFLFDTTQSMKVDHYSLTVTYSITSPKPIGLEILSHSSYIDGVGYMHIVGEIENIGTVRATYVKIVATCYDETGKVVDADFTFSDPMDIDPAQKAPFEILVGNERTPFVSSYELTAESSQYALIPELSLLTILSLFMIVTLLAVIVFRKVKYLKDY